jgi:salicylate hydroxylase
MDLACEVLGEAFARNGNVNIGPGGLTTTYPVENGTMLNVVAARDQPTWDSPEWVIPADKEAITQEFKDYGPKMRQVVSLLKNPKKWALWHHPETSTYYRGRLAIIGDAAHASTPHQGAGAGQAFEDALIMCELLAHSSVQTVDDIEHAFAAYDIVRRSRTLRVVNTSRENGAVCMMKGAETGEDWDKIKADLDTRFEWIWYEDLGKQVESAVQKLRQFKEESLAAETRMMSKRVECS